MPAAQPEQRIDPVAAEYMPAWHVPQLDVPVLVAEVPAGQLKQAFAPLSEYAPAGQLVQTADPAAPVADEKRPARHATQLDAPNIDW